MIVVASRKSRHSAAIRLVEACEASGLQVMWRDSRDAPAEAIATIDFDGDMVGGEREIWRFETEAGGDVFRRFPLASVWHRPPFFAELRLVRRTATPGGMALLRTARISTRMSYKLFCHKLLATAALMVRQAVNRGARMVPPALPPTPRASPPRVPFVIGWMRRQVAVWASRLLTEWWSIGVCELSIDAILRSGAIGPVRWLQPTPSAAYWADPFYWPERGLVMCEECEPNSSAGRLVALDVQNAATRVVLRLALASNWHHSYPYIWEERGQTFLLPECLESGEAVLYRLSPDGDVIPVVVIARKRLADPTLFRHAEHYWIAATDVEIGEHDNLVLFYATALTGPWREHPENPVKIDVGSSRPAGTPFTVNGRLFRPSQDCVGSYGGAVVINEVVELSPTSFNERPACRLAPARGGPFPDGLHTLSSIDGRALIDGKRLFFSPATVVAKAVRRLGLQRRE